MEYHTSDTTIDAIQVKRDNMNEVLDWCLACEPIFDFKEIKHGASSNISYIRFFGGFMVHNSKGSICANISDYIVKLENDYIVLDESKFKVLFSDEKEIISHLRIEFDGEKIAEAIKAIKRSGKP